MSQAKTFNKLNYEETMEVLKTQQIRSDISYRLLNTVRSLQSFPSLIASPQAQEEIENATPENSTTITQTHKKALLGVFSQLLK